VAGLVLVIPLGLDILYWLWTESHRIDRLEPDAAKRPTSVAVWSIPLFTVSVGLLVVLVSSAIGGIPSSGVPAAITSRFPGLFAELSTAGWQPSGFGLGVLLLGSLGVFVAGIGSLVVLWRLLRYVEPRAAVSPSGVQVRSVLAMTLFVGAGLGVRLLSVPTWAALVAQAAVPAPVAAWA
jgi:hypothetical protein